jgi:hypothetical protein
LEDPRLTCELHGRLGRSTVCLGDTRPTLGDQRLTWEIQCGLGRSEAYLGDPTSKACLGDPRPTWEIQGLLVRSEADMGDPRPAWEIRGLRGKSKACLGDARPTWEILAQGLPFRSGTQLAVDVTLRTVLSGNGQAKPRAADVDGVVAEAARRDKEAVYPELLAARRCALIVVAIETGGRWSNEADMFVTDLSHARARDAPPALRVSAALAWHRRCTRLLSIACATSFARSLIAPAEDVAAGIVDGATPMMSELFSRDGGCDSRIPLRG